MLLSMHYHHLDFIVGQHRVSTPFTGRDQLQHVADLAAAAAAALPLPSLFSKPANSSPHYR
jgi:hypothetical protein